MLYYYQIYLTILLLLLLSLLQGVPEKIAQTLCVTILQPYVTESCCFQQNVQKEIVYTTKASYIFKYWQLYIFCVENKINSKIF